jgi:hypothetical protein
LRLKYGVFALYIETSNKPTGKMNEKCQGHMKKVENSENTFFKTPRQYFTGRQLQISFSAHSLEIENREWSGAFCFRV